MTALPSGETIGSYDDDVFSTSESLEMQHCFDQREVTSICHNKETDVLIASSREGCISIYSCYNKGLAQSSYSPFDGISIVSKTDFESTLSHIKSLEDSVQTLRSEHTQDIDSSSSNGRVLQEQVKYHLQLKLDRLQYGISELVGDINAAFAQHNSEVTKLEDQHVKNLQSAREDCEKKLATEKSNTDKFVKKCEDKTLEHESLLII